MAQSGFIEEIISALGTRIRASDKEKHDFALYLYAELNKARYQPGYTEAYGEIVSSLRDVQSSLTAFQESIYKAHNIFRSNQPAFLDKKYIKDVAQLIEYFEIYNTELTKEKPSEKEGRHKPASYLVAKMIAKQYLQHFGFPTTGKGEVISNGLKVTPYDKVCQAVAAHYKIDLSSHTLREAIKAIRTIRTIKKVRNITGGIRGIGRVRG